jgi:hypothetical protein
MSSPSSYTYSLVLPGLYLGGDGYLKDPTIIDEADITHIVSIGDEYGFVQSLPYVTVCWLGGSLYAREFRSRSSATLL